MNVKVTARKFKAHETLREYAKDEVSGLEKYYDGLITAEVILSFEKPRDSVKTAEITLAINGKQLVAQESTDDFIKSIDQAVEKLERQIRKFKTKKIDNKKTVRKPIIEEE